MKKNIFQKSAESIRRKFFSPQQESTKPLKPKVRRPLTISESYSRHLDEPEMNALFTRLRRRVFQELQDLEASKGRALATRETGKLSYSQPYFYIKPFGDKGWLFERSEKGWVISRAEKIHSSDMFIRDDYAWDVATCLTNAQYEATPRVNSKKFDISLMALSLYEERVLQEVLGQL